jgi:hypothetical protein
MSVNMFIYSRSLFKTYLCSATLKGDYSLILEPIYFFLMNRFVYA